MCASPTLWLWPRHLTYGENLTSPTLSGLFLNARDFRVDKINHNTIGDWPIVATGQTNGAIKKRFAIEIETTDQLDAGNGGSRRM